MSKLANKCALITGGGSGVGQATAKLFVAAGAKVVIAGRDAAKLEAAVAAIGDGVSCIAADVSKPDQAERLVRESTERLGRVDVLVNNAGTNLKNRTMRELTIEDWQRLLDTNLSGAFYCIRAVLQQMITRQDGVIVNINSISGLRGYPLAGAAYCASKFGLAGLGMCLAGEERESGIRVSNIYPGEIDTPILEVRPTPVTAAQRAVILKPEDVAEAVLFVASLPAHASVPELIIKPTSHPFV